MSTQKQHRLSLYNPRAPRPETRRAARPQPAAPATRAFTSREAAEISEVPFFTIDYWSRTRFLVPSIAAGSGRGKGRQRLYSYGDILRLRIARELRDQKVSLETLRAVVQKLARSADELPAAHFALVGDAVVLVRSLSALAALLRQPSRETFGVLLDLRTLNRTVRARALAILQPEA